jgi:hypothetical protein
MGLVHALLTRYCEVEGKVSCDKDTNWDFQNLLAKLQSSNTAQRSFIDIPRSLENAKTPGHSSTGNKASLLVVEGAGGTILMRYHHVSWSLCSRRKVARTKSIFKIV